MHISEALSGILIKAALSAETKPEKLDRLIILYYEGFDVLVEYYRLLKDI